MADILLIDDDPKIRQAYEALLKKAGFEVRTAENGKQGLAAAESKKPDLILLDVFMPVMSGLDFLKQYSPKQKHPEVKVIVLTNVEEPFYKAMELGATDYVVKSDVSGKEMAEIIKQTLAS